MVPAGRISKEAGHVIDISATCYAAAGAAYPKTRGGKDIVPLEGRSLLPTLKGAEQPVHDMLYWEHEGNRAVREGKWKLVAKNRGEWELYDIEADRIEQNDLAAKESERVQQMSAAYAAWARRAGVVEFDKLPKPKRPATTRAAR